MAVSELSQPLRLFWELFCCRCLADWQSSCMSGDPTTVTSATNHSIFIKWPWVDLLRLKRVFLHHKVAPQPKAAWICQKTTKIISKIARSALSRDLTAVTSATNHFIFIKWPYVSKVIRAKRGFSHHKVAPRSQIRPELAKITVSQNHPQNSMFCSARGSNSWCIGYQQLHFR